MEGKLQDLHGRLDGERADLEQTIRTREQQLTENDELQHRLQVWSLGIELCRDSGLNNNWQSLEQL